MSIREFDDDELYFNTIKLGSRETSANKKDSVVSSCRICLSSMLSPARLVCGHRFCESCLNKYWKAMEKPEYLICPLCREFAVKVGFVQDKGLLSTEDFRKRFDQDHGDPSSDSTNDIATALCLKISLLMPLIYVIVKLLRPIVRALLLWL